MAVWVRVLFAALGFYGLTILSDYVAQQRPVVLLAAPDKVLMLDKRTGEVYWIPPLDFTPPPVASPDPDKKVGV